MASELGVAPARCSGTPTGLSTVRTAGLGGSPGGNARRFPLSPTEFIQDTVGTPAQWLFPGRLTVIPLRTRPEFLFSDLGCFTLEV